MISFQVCQANLILMSKVFSSPKYSLKDKLSTLSLLYTEGQVRSPLSWLDLWVPPLQFSLLFHVSLSPPSCVLRHLHVSPLENHSVTRSFKNYPCIFIKIFFLYFFERKNEKEHERRVGGRGRSRLTNDQRAQCWTWSQGIGTMTWAEDRCLTDFAIQAPWSLFLKILFTRGQSTPSKPKLLIPLQISPLLSFLETVTTQAVSALGSGWCCVCVWIMHVTTSQRATYAPSVPYLVTSRRTGLIKVWNPKHLCIWPPRAQRQKNDQVTFRHFYEHELQLRWI